MIKYTQIKLNVYSSPKDERDLNYDKLIDARLIQFPRELDLRSGMLGVRDQGAQGACAAMAGASMKDWQEIKDIGIKEHTSPQFIYNNRKNSDSEGMYMRDLMKILKNKGVCFESSHPYGNKKKSTQDAIDEAKNHVIGAYLSINTIIGLKSVLSSNGPCIIVIPVYNYTKRMWHQFPGQPLLGGHAMTVVGYNKEGFIIRNSWGDDWNNDGHTIFPYQDWGSQWEIWTSEDAKSNLQFTPTPSSKGCLSVAIFVGLILTSLGVLIL